MGAEERVENDEKNVEDAAEHEENTAEEDNVVENAELDGEVDVKNAGGNAEQDGNAECAVEHSAQISARVRECNTILILVI